MSARLPPLSVPSRYRRKSLSTSDGRPSPPPTWSSTYNPSSPSFSPPTSSSPPPRTPFSASARHSYGYARIHGSPRLAFEFGFNIPDIDESPPWYSRASPKASQHSYSLPSFSSSFPSDDELPLASEYDASEFSDDYSTDDVKYLSSGARRANPSTGSRYFVLDEEEWHTEQHPQLDFRDRDMRGTFFTISAERGQWKNDPLPTVPRTTSNKARPVSLPVFETVHIELKTEEQHKVISTDEAMMADVTFPGTTSPSPPSSISLNSNDPTWLLPAPLSEDNGLGSISPPCPPSSILRYLAPQSPPSPLHSLKPESTESETRMSSPLSPAPTSCVSPISVAPGLSSEPVSPLSMVSNPPEETNSSLPGETPSDVPLVEVVLDSNSDMGEDMEVELSDGDDYVPLDARVCKDVQFPSSTDSRSEIPPEAAIPSCVVSAELKTVTPKIDVDVLCDSCTMDNGIEDAFPASPLSDVPLSPISECESLLSIPTELCQDAEPRAVCSVVTPCCSSKSNAIMSTELPTEIVGPASAVLTSDCCAFASGSGSTVLSPRGASPPIFKPKVEDKDDTEGIVHSSKKNTVKKRGKMKEKNEDQAMNEKMDLVEKVKRKKRISHGREEGATRKRSRTLQPVEQEAGEDGPREKTPDPKKRNGESRKRKENKERKENSDMHKSSQQKENLKGGDKQVKVRRRSSTSASSQPYAESNSECDCDPTSPSLTPSPADPTWTRDELLGMLVESMAISRASSLPASSLCRTILQSRPALMAQQNEQEWLGVFQDVLAEGWRGCGVFGMVESSGKDDAGCALEAQWFYVPERDQDQERAALIRSMMPRPAKRSETKKYKQYYYRPLEKMSRWDPEDEM